MIRVAEQDEKRSRLNNRPSARFPFSCHFLSRGARHPQMPFARARRDMTVPIGRAVNSANYRPSLRIVFCGRGGFA
jgi:hypothetical protein